MQTIKGCSDEEGVVQMTTRKLCEMIEMPDEVIDNIEKIEVQVDFSEMSEELVKLTVPEKYTDAHKALKAKIVEDEKGFIMLTCQLQAMKLTFDKYEKCGISEEIFIDTMKCFSRFIAEHKESYGCYGFDRDWWVGRQLSMQLFRIGELEYEILPEEISIHIPSDAKLTEKNCRESYEQTKEFLEKFCGNAAAKPFCCASWLLSPALEQLLPPDSHINRFRKAFRLLNWEQDSAEFMQWVYKRRDIPLEQLPEHTTLARRMKAHLLSGGKVGEAKGVLVESPWFMT